MSRSEEVNIIIERILNTTNYYHMLGVSNDASEDQIKTAGRILMKKIHPDKCKHAKATEAFQVLSHAAIKHKASKKLEQDRQNDANSKSRTTSGTADTSDTDIDVVLEAIGIGLLAAGAGLALGAFISWLFGSDETMIQAGTSTANKRKIGGTNYQQRGSNASVGKKMKMGSTSTKKT